MSDHRSTALGRPIRRALALCALLALLPYGPAGADMVIRLKDGRTITVPVARDQIDEILFTRDHAGPGDAPRPDAAAPRAETAKGPAATEATPAPAGTVHRVGPGRAYERPSDLVRIAKDGDTIEIEAGVYDDDSAVWNQNRLTLRGVGGRAHMRTHGAIPNGKAIWVIRGDGVLVERIEFSGARVRDRNGAGIRHEGGKLTIRDSYFHDNQMGLLAGRLPDGEIVIEGSEFAEQRRDGRYTHGIYVGHVRSFTLRNSYVHHTDQGHQVKTRARTSYILYNRISDHDDGNSSYLIDIPNCGRAYVIGNVLEQGAKTSNYHALAYGSEGCAGRDKGLYVVNNTFINRAEDGFFVRNKALAPARLVNNLMLGRGEIADGPVEGDANLQAPAAALADVAGGDFRPRPGGGAVDAGVEPGEGPEMKLVPRFHYVHPRSLAPRPHQGGIDIGAYEAGLGQGG